MRCLVYLGSASLPDGRWTSSSTRWPWPAGSGLFVTALNLVPGGPARRRAHRLRALRRATGRSRIATFVGLLALGGITGSGNWFVWAGLLFFLIGFHHSPPLDDRDPAVARPHV